jgi:DNA-binding HxlR family transcriptional regulator
MAALELLGRRWTMRIVWELRDEPATFRELQRRCGGISPSVVSARTGELREARIVEQTADGYALTTLGRGLLEAFGPIDAWAKKWARALARD